MEWLAYIGVKNEKEEEEISRMRARAKREAKR